MPRIATVQLEPSYMDPDAGLERIEHFVVEAVGEDASTVVFPELLIPGYPRYVGDPFPHTAEGDASWDDIQRYHQEYVLRSQTVPGPVTDALGAIAARHGVTLVVGLSEKDPHVRARLWNTAVVLGPDGALLGRHRKLVGVMHERLYFNRGGAEDVAVVAAPDAVLGLCICFENLHTQYRRAISELGQEIHCALWTAPSPRAQAAEGVTLEQHREIGVAQALDSGTFVVIASQVGSCVPDGGDYGSNWAHSGGSLIIDPLGRTIARVPDWEEGIAVADCDLGLIDTARLVWSSFSDDAREDLFGSPARMAAAARAATPAAPAVDGPSSEAPGPPAATSSAGRSIVERAVEAPVSP